MDESVVQDMITLADTDGDGKVSLDEFKVIMRAGPKIKPSSRPGGPASAGGWGAVRQRRRSRGDVVSGEAAGGGGEGVDDPLSSVTHFLLLLNRKTFVGARGKRLAHTLRAALGLPEPDERLTLTAEQRRASSEQSLFKACSDLKLELDQLKLSTRASSTPSDLGRAAETAANPHWRARLAAVRPYLKTQTLPGLGAAGARREGSPRRPPGARPTDRSRRTARRGRDLVDKAVGDLGDLLAGAAGEASRIKLVLVHAVDAQEDGCEFDHFFSVTPPDLIHAGQLFRMPAVPLFSSPAFRAVSIELVVAQQHGPERPPARSGPPAALHEPFRWPTPPPLHPRGPRGKPSPRGCCGGTPGAPGARLKSPVSPPLST